MKYLSTRFKPALIPVLLSSTVALTGCLSDSKSDAVSELGEEIISAVDSSAPEITLMGEEDITIFQNTSYADEGASASDNIDGNVNVTTTGSVDEMTAGTYTLTYTATDTAGNSSTATRTINVIPVTLSGTAAGGAAIVGTVVVKGSLGNVKSSVIEADGSYEVDVTGLTAPYRLRAEGTVGGKSYKLHSYAEEASVNATVNITPFTDLIIANTAHQLAANFFDSNIDTSLDADELDAQEDALQDKLQNVFDALGLDTAINLLNTSFSADHSGLDAALDLISIDTDENNIATITNLLDDTSITDDITDSDDNSAVITIDESSLTTAVSDTVAIANVFDSFTAAFSEGLPKPEDIEDFFSEGFLNEDESLGQFMTDITTEPELIGLSFISVSINDLDSTAGTALVSFSVMIGGIVDAESEQWYVERDETLGWQLAGDQKIVDLHELSYNCNYFESAEGPITNCGIHTGFEDNNVDNNGPNGELVLSASVSIIDGDDGTIKDTFYLGTPDNDSESGVYSEEHQHYQGDWRDFGTGAGQIDPSIFKVGDSIVYNFYEANLDLTDAENPTITGNPLFTYEIPVNYEPNTEGKYPTATETTIEILDNFTFDEDLTIAWELAEGTRVDGVDVEIYNNQGSFVLRVEEDTKSHSDAVTDVTFDKSLFDQNIWEDSSFNPSEGYSIRVRIIAEDNENDQNYHREYQVYYEGDNSDGTMQPPITTLTCGYESGWNDDASDGLGAPINANSFSDFETVVNDCGSAISITQSNIAGSTWLDDGESKVYHDDGLATKASPSTGQIIDGDDVIDFIWYLETHVNNTYIVLETDSERDSDLPADFWLRETAIITAIQTAEAVNDVSLDGEEITYYEVSLYSEQSNFSDDARDNGTDGEIWNAIYKKSTTLY